MIDSFCFTFSEPLQAPGPLGCSGAEGLEGMLVCRVGPGCNNAGVARAICQVRHGGLEPLVLALGEGRREGTGLMQAYSYRKGVTTEQFVNASENT